MPRGQRPTVKDERRYERLREQGESKTKAARIANTPPRQAGKRGGQSDKYENWSRDDLYEQARRIGIEGRSRMNKQELIAAIRNH